MLDMFAMAAHCMKVTRRCGFYRLWLVGTLVLLIGTGLILRPDHDAAQYAYISKPISVPEFLQTLERLVAGKGINPAPECVPARSPIIDQILRMPQPPVVNL